MTYNMCVCIYIYICIYSFLIGSKKANIIKKGIEGKIHRVHDIEQRANQKKKKNRNKKSLNYSIRDN